MNEKDLMNDEMGIESETTSAIKLLSETNESLNKCHEKVDAALITFLGIYPDSFGLNDPPIFLRNEMDGKNDNTISFSQLNEITPIKKDTPKHLFLTEWVRACTNENESLVNDAMKQLEIIERDKMKRKVDTLSQLNATKKILNNDNHTNINKKKKLFNDKKQVKEYNKIDEHEYILSKKKQNVNKKNNYLIIQEDSANDSDNDIIYNNTKKNKNNKNKNKKDNNKEEEETYKVDYIMKKKIEDGENKYFIKWSGYPLEESTWEPAENITPDLLKDFLNNEQLLNDEKDDNNNDNTNKVKKRFNRDYFNIIKIKDKKIKTKKSPDLLHDEEVIYYLCAWEGFKELSWENASNVPTSLRRKYDIRVQRQHEKQ